MNREEHLAWCKARALELLDAGDAKQAVTSMLSDLGKHEETKGSLDWAGPLGLLALMSDEAHEARRFIEGFN